MSLTFRDENNPITTKDVVDFESEYGLKFPDAYKAFLLKTNGGVIGFYDGLEYRHNVFGDTSLIVESLYGIKSTYNVALMKTDDLGEVRNQLSEFLPPDYLAVGEAHGGHIYIVVSLSEHNRGYIFLWDDQFPMPKFLHLVSNSFDKFCSLVRDLNVEE